MGTIHCRVTYRPLRIGWCVRSSSLEQVVEAMRLAHCFWGGTFGPLLPVDIPEVATRLAALFRVDALHPISKGEDFVSFLAAHPYLPWPFLGEGVFSDEPGNNRARMLDVRHRALRLEEARTAGRLELTFNPVQPNWRADDPLAPAFAAMLGSYPESDPGPYYEQIVSLLSGATKLTIEPTAELPVGLARDSIASILAKDGLHTNIPRFDRTPGFFVGDASSASDLVAYWNLRAADIFLVFIDESHWDRLRLLADGYVTYLRSTWERASIRQPYVSVWGTRDWRSHPLSIDLAPDTPKLWCPVSTETWNGLNVQPGLPEIETEFTIASVEAQYGKPVTYVPLTRKPFYEQQWASRQHFVASIEPITTPSEYEEVTFCPPHVPRLNECYSRNLHFDPHSVRAELESVGIVTAVSEHHVMLRGLEY